MIVFTSWAIIDRFIEDEIGTTFSTCGADRAFLRSRGITTLAIYPTDTGGDIFTDISSLDYVLVHKYGLEFDDPEQELIFRMKYL